MANQGMKNKTNNTQKKYTLEVIDRDTGEVVQTETRKSPQAFDKLFCKAMSNVNGLKYKLKVIE